MKIIFLDIDGVLNSRQYDLCRSENDGNIDVTRLEMLKSLTDVTYAEIVLTSTWRSHWDPDGINTDDIGKGLEEIFVKYGMTLYGKTPYLGNDRAKEIMAWIEEHPEVESFVIFDDIKLGWGELDEKVVKTDPRIGRGVEDYHIAKAKEILSSSD